MGQVIPLHTEFLSEDETARLEPVRHAFREWVTRRGINIGIVFSIAIWAGFIALALTNPKILVLIIGSLFMLGCIASVVIGAWRK